MNGLKNRLDERGVWVTIRREEGGTVEGWLVGEIPQGLLVALDEELRDVRLVPQYSSIGFNHEKRLPKLYYQDADELMDELAKANVAMAPQLRQALSRLKFDQIHEFGYQASELEVQISYHSLMQERDFNSRGPSALEDLTGFLIAQTDRSISLHRAVYETFESSGLSDVMDRFGPKVAKFPSEITIPAYDLQFTTREDLTTTLEATRKRRWSARKHQASLGIAEATRTRLIADAARRDRTEALGEPQRSSDSTIFSRWVGPSLRVLAGTGLAAANAAIGVTAGLTGTIATIGSTAVPTYVGIVTSIYTGFAQVADGLEKIGRNK